MFNAGKLREYEAVERIYNQAFEATGKVKTMTADVITQLAQKIKDRVSNDIGKLRAIAQYLIMMYLGADVQETVRNKLYTDFPGLDAAEALPIKQLFAMKLPSVLAKYSVTAKNAETLIRTLLQTGEAK